MTKEWIKKSIDLNEYFEDLKTLKELLSNQALYYIYGIPRGGSIISVFLSHWLNLDFIKINPLDISNLLDPATVLIVDDIADTGETLMPYVSHNFTTATIYYKERSIVIPDFYVHKTEDWIVFPYEKLDEIPNRNRQI